MADQPSRPPPPPPPPVRTSLIDSGWESEPVKGRELPKYEEGPRDLLITRVDDQIQSRIEAMNAAEDSRRFTDVTVPDAVVIEDLLPPSDEHTLVEKATFPSSVPPAPPPLPQLPHVPQLGAVLTTTSATPSLVEALKGRVRIAGGEVPLWATVLPAFLVTALVAALIGGAVSGGDSTGEEPASSLSASAEGAAVAAPKSEHKKSAGSGADATSRATPLSDAKLKELEKKKPAELGTDEALAIASTKALNAESAARTLAERLGADPGLAKDPKVITSLLGYAKAPETARYALSAMAKLPGALSADLLYEVWTGTAERSDTTELARTLLLGKDVRPKASPALSVALDLREAESCEANAKLIPRATELGDKRSLSPITKLMRKTGCGPGKRQDCYPCLREGDALTNALVAVKKRREPELGTP